MFIAIIISGLIFGTTGAVIENNFDIIKTEQTQEKLNNDF